jgi:hypothetical protein
MALFSFLYFPILLYGALQHSCHCVMADLAYFSLLIFDSQMVVAVVVAQQGCRSGAAAGLAAFERVA